MVGRQTTPRGTSELTPAGEARGRLTRPPAARLDLVTREDPPQQCMGRKAPRGLEQDFVYADKPEGEAYQQRQYNTTVLEADLYEQTYLEVFPSQAVTNPPPKDMSYVNPYT